MSNVVIQVENLTKEYRLGTINHGTLYRDLQSWWARLRGKEDPNSLVGHNSPSPFTVHPSQPLDSFLALNDVSFEVQQGDVVGIIGRNGAGKSTLLKILSQVTCPTSGVVKLNGRVASLLEVGTGFHPELTGRENVFLNGAILGMSKSEIARKFDEIIAFAEIEKFIDTPVKRYSSGMYVRLAFAVAAHLEPEILIIDEVLAVGDAQFQKKCLGKMEDVGKEGRTVLFVSHNMAAINRLCSKCVYLNSGKVMQYGATSLVIDHYQLGRDNTFSGQIVFPKNDSELMFISAEMSNDGESPKGIFRSDEDIHIKVKYEIKRMLLGVNVVVNITSLENESIWGVGDWEVHPQLLDSRNVGIWECTWIFPANVLRPGMYNIHLGAGSQIKSYHNPEPFPFEITTEGAWRNAYHKFGISGGPVAHMISIAKPILCK